MRGTVASHIISKRKLHCTRLDLGGNLREQMRVMKHIFQQLEEKSVYIPEFQGALIVPSSFDSSWDNFALRLENVPEKA